MSIKIYENFKVYILSRVRLNIYPEILNNGLIVNRLMNIFLILGLLILLQGCEATRYLKRNELLIKNNPSYIGNHGINSEKLNSGILSKPNRKILIVKAYLHIYNLGRAIETDSSFLRKIAGKIDNREFIYREVPKWLKENIGEKPHIIDEAQLIDDCKNLENIYYANGYFSARARYRIERTFMNPYKANVYFHIDEGPSFYINKIVYESRDTNLINLLAGEVSGALVKAGDRYNEDNLAEERTRITEFLRENGRYRALASQISYRIDTFLDKSDIKPRILDAALKFYRKKKNHKLPERKFLNIIVTLPDSLAKYKISEVRAKIRIFPSDSLSLDLDPDLSIQKQLMKYGYRSGKLELDNKIRMLIHPNVLRVLNLNTVSGVIAFRRDNFFSLSSSRLTQRRLQEMGIFSNSIIRFIPNDSTKTLIAETELGLQKRFSYKLGFEAFQADQYNLGSNYPGLGMNGEFLFRNAFKRAEQISTVANANFLFISEAINATENPQSSGNQIFIQWGGRVNFRTPRFWFIDRLANKAVKANLLTINNPATAISVNYRRDNPIIFVRNTFSMDFAYQWFHNENRFKYRKVEQFSVVTPLTLTIVKSIYKESELIPKITGKPFGAHLTDADEKLVNFLKQDLDPRFTSFSSYYRTISNNYGQSRKRNTWYLRAGLELGGNIPYILDWVGQNNSIGDSSHKDAILQLGMQRYRYGQFIRTSIEGRWYVPFSKSTEIVSRCFVGFSKGINYTHKVPLENRFFSGGTASVRGWQSNTLGPGTVVSPSYNAVFLGGEYKFEANVEYRQDLTGPIEMAIFLDMGNVWFSSNSNFERPEGKLSFKNLKLGVASGIGLRFDLTFVVLRFDVGQQIYAPDIQKWVLNDGFKLGFPRIQYNLAIGYPF